MGILNVTPDSFYDGGKYSSDKIILNQAERMLNAGASIIDVGGMSTRPGASVVSEEEELSRTTKVVELISKTFPDAVISIDTFRSKVAREAILCGAGIINDISGGKEDEHIFEVAAKFQTPLILMHKQGSVEQMHQQTNYENILTSIFDYFSIQIKKATDFGIKDVVIDVGFGFSKTIEQNFHLLKHLHVFKQLNKPVLAGLSRKSMLYKTLNSTPQEALNATTFAHTLALQQGASILRVHDVKEAMECIKLNEQLEKA